MGVLALAGLVFLPVTADSAARGLWVERRPCTALTWAQVPPCKRQDHCHIFPAIMGSDLDIEAQHRDAHPDISVTDFAAPAIQDCNMKFTKGLLLLQTTLMLNVCLL